MVKILSFRFRLCHPVINVILEEFLGGDQGWLRKPFVIFGNLDLFPVFEYLFQVVCVIGKLLKLPIFYNP